ncbi:DUF2786 domain-containing protein [Actinomadura sp. WMMA1423]|uniref:DUF2786 domain-containing protein n=1 Tax=Actinomadura sp. WMMA1423 TaxID=2591108 RepID=UPI0011461510|nr:DUF2786 domain-containing protein [Actinomadura sp. WMMA1423]
MRKTWRRGTASEESAALAVDEAVRSLARGDRAAFRRLVAELTTGGGDVPAWTAAADHRLADRLRHGVTTAWRRGWQPADLVRFTARRHTPRHARLSADAIADEMRAYPSGAVDDRWHEQLAVLGAEVWWPDDGSHPALWCRREGVERAVYVACALEIVQLLETLPKLPAIGPPPGATGGSGVFGRSKPRRAEEVDQRILVRVRALLAKAESTEFPEEAEALSARAQELMARHSIDHALLAAETGDLGGPDGRRIAVDSPYDAPKAVLLTVVAEANRCRAIWHRELGFSTVLGFPADLAAVEILFTSLLVQATSAMVNAGPRRDARGRSRTRSFRHAFLNAYAVRIGERLRGAADRAAADAGGKDLLPVLAARDQAVDQAVDTMFPDLAKGRAGSVSNYEGWLAGRAAADLASLNGRSEVTEAFRGR